MSNSNKIGGHAEQPSNPISEQIEYIPGLGNIPGIPSIGNIPGIGGVGTAIKRGLQGQNPLSRGTGAAPSAPNERTSVGGIIDIQEALVSYGLLQGGYHRGIVDGPTESAVYALHDKLAKAQAADTYKGPNFEVENVLKRVVINGRSHDYMTHDDVFAGIIDDLRSHPQYGTHGVTTPPRSSSAPTITTPPRPRSEAEPLASPSKTAGVDPSEFPNFSASHVAENSRPAIVPLPDQGIKRTI